MIEPDFRDIRTTARVLHRDEIVDVLRREVDRSARQGIPFGVIIATVINADESNRSKGPRRLPTSEVLGKVGSVTAGLLRSYDSVGLYGPVTWLIVAPGCDGAGIKRVLQRLREALAPFVIGSAGTGAKISMKFIASSVCGAEIRSLDPILDAADRIGGSGTGAVGRDGPRFAP